jgi:hypothetical protein
VLSHWRRYRRESNFALGFFTMQKQQVQGVAELAFDITTAVEKETSSNECRGQAVAPLGSGGHFF